MRSQLKLRLSARQHGQLRAHLFPGDGKEAVALALCGRSAALGTEILLVHKLFPIEHSRCQRSAHQVTWPATDIEPLLRQARKGFSLLKIHSHPAGFDAFSSIDDESDAVLFESVFGWIENDRPHASAIMLPDGRINARSVGPDGVLGQFDLVEVVGDDVKLWPGAKLGEKVPEFAASQTQLFGPGTTKLIGQLRIGVVGCSGTGSIVVEQLARLGSGELVLIDPDVVEDRNLNRIVGATAIDVQREAPKVDVMSRSIAAIGLGTIVHTFQAQIDNHEAIRAVASCDFVFGCVDSLVGRHRLGRISRYYILPYIDTGVKLEALPDGTINQVASGVHYVQPDGLDLISRGMFTSEQLEAEDLFRSNPDDYAERRARGYLRGVEVRKPAVISVNMHAASLAVSEMLARVHRIRLGENADFATTRFSFSHGYFAVEAEPDEAVSPRDLALVGRGDDEPMLGLPGLAEPTS